MFDDEFVLLFFFFKQKTAYEMRISDWSSDVCSSDLWSGGARPTGGQAGWSRRRGRAWPNGSRAFRQANWKTMTMPMATGRPSTEDSGISFLRGPRHTVICSPAGRRERARGWERDWVDPASGPISARRVRLAVMIGKVDVGEQG